MRGERPQAEACATILPHLTCSKILPHLTCSKILLHLTCSKILPHLTCRKNVVQRALLFSALLFSIEVVAQDGAAAYKQNCAACHDGGNDRAPSLEALRAMTPDRVLAAMESGPMISMASRLKAADRRAIAEFVTGKSFSQPLVTTPPASAMCRGSASSAMMTISVGPAIKSIPTSPASSFLAAAT